MPLTQQEIADRLGLTLVHVNRVLRRIKSSLPHDLSATVPSLTYSPRCGVASEPRRWRRKGTRRRGVCFAAGLGVWVGAGVSRDGLYRGDRGPTFYGPAGIRAAAR